MFVNQVCSVVAIVGKTQDRPFFLRRSVWSDTKGEILLSNQNCTTNGLLTPGVSLYEGVSFGLLLVREDQVARAIVTLLACTGPLERVLSYIVVAAVIAYTNSAVV
jgi:hypothetical protein